MSLWLLTCYMARLDKLESVELSVSSLICETQVVACFNALACFEVLASFEVLPRYSGVKLAGIRFVNVDRTPSLEWCAEGLIW